MQQQQCLQASAPRKKKASPWWDFLSHCKEADDSSDSEDDSPQEIDDRSCANHNGMMTCNAGQINSTNDDLTIKESALVKSIGARSKGSADDENDGEAAPIHPQTPRTQDSSFSSCDTRSSSSSIPDDDEDKAFEVSSFQSIEADESDDDCSFIGSIEIMPISSFLSSQQRNIRKNAYNLLMRLGEEESMFDLNSTVETEVGREREVEGDNYCDDRLQRQKQQQEVENLKCQLGECKDMVLQLHANLRSYSNYEYATNVDYITSVEMNNDNDHEDDDINIMAELRSEIVNLKNHLQSATLQSRHLVHESMSMIGFPSLVVDEVDKDCKDIRGRK